MCKAILACLLAALSGQTLLAQELEPPRTSSGRQNLQGVWTNKTLPIGL